MFKALALVVGLAFPAFAQQPNLAPVAFRDFSGGYVDNVDPVKLQPNESPDLLNVVVDDPVGSVKPRRGLRRCGNLPSGSAATALYEYTKSDGTRRLIASDNNTIYSTPDCSSWTTIKTGLGASNRVYFATVRDKLWIVNGSTWAATWDGTTYTQLTGATGSSTPNPAPPKCSFIEFWKERVWCGSPLGDASAVAFSALTDSSGNDVDPSTGSLAWPAINAFQIDQNAGSRLYGIKAYRNRLYAFKDNGVWEIGFNNEFDNFVRKTYASVGSRYQSSIWEVDGVLYFTGRDGIYAFDGDNAVRISERIKNKFFALNQPLISQNYKTWTSLGDFQAGTASSVTLTATPGSIVLSTQTANLTNGTFENGVNISPWSCTYELGTVTNSHPYARACQAISSNSATGYPPITGTWSFAATGKCGPTSSCSGAVTKTYKILSAVSGSTLTAGDLNTANGASLSQSIDVSGYIGQSIILKLESVAGGGAAGDNVYVYSGSFTVVSSSITFNFIGMDAGNAHGWAALDDFSNSAYFSQGKWTSQIYNTVAVSTWGAFNATHTENGGSVAYEIRYGTDTGATQSMAFASISPGVLIPAATNQIYVQLRATLNAPASLAASPQVDDLQIAWNSGGANTQQIYAYGWRNELWVNASSGTASTNNLTMRKAKAPINSWTLHDLQLGPMTTYNDAFYAAASTHSAIYRADYGTNDDGAAITWYWTSKDENWGLPNNSKYLTEINADYRNDTACNLHIGYVADDETAYCVGNAQAYGSGIGSRRLNVSGGPAFTYRFKVCSDQLDESATINGITGWTRAIPRRGN